MESHSHTRGLEGRGDLTEHIPSLISHTGTKAGIQTILMDLHICTLRITYQNPSRWIVASPLTAVSILPLR